MTDEPLGDSPLTPERFGQLALVAQLPVFAYLGGLVFDDLAFGAVVGLLIGGGTMLHLPELLRWAAAGDDGVRPPGGADTRRAAAGLAVDGAGIVAFAARFAVDGAALAVVAGVVAGLGAYVALQYVLSSSDASTGG